MSCMDANKDKIQNPYAKNLAFITKTKSKNMSFMVKAKAN